MNMKKKISIVRSIESPLRSFYDLCELAGGRLSAKELSDFDLKKLVPKVVDDFNNGVYEYCLTGKLYFYNEGEVTEVVPTHILFDEDGYADMDDDELMGMYDNIYCGEADDCSCYVFFEAV